MSSIESSLQGMLQGLQRLLQEVALIAQRATQQRPPASSGSTAGPSSSSGSGGGGSSGSGSTGSPPTTSSTTAAGSVSADTQAAIDAQRKMARNSLAMSCATARASEDSAEGQQIAAAAIGTNAGNTEMCKQTASHVTRGSSAG